MIDLGLSYVGKIKYYASRKFFTVEDGEDVDIYEHPSGESKKNIRIAIHVAYIDEQRYNLDGEYTVTGRYPNYRIEEVK
jgi:hypothetical protein